MDEKVTSLTNDQIEFACRMFSKWMHTCVDNDRGYGPADVDHSALLWRLLSGKGMHDRPPPKNHSSPAWNMVEDDLIEIGEICDGPHWLKELTDEKGKVIYTGPTIAVNRCAEYYWEDKEKRILCHPRLGLRFEYFEEELTPRHIGKPGRSMRQLSPRLNPEEHKYMAKFLRRLK